MSKVIHVTLHGISCDLNRSGLPVSISGEVVGSTYRTDPDNLADLEDTFVIHGFRNGPITIDQGQTVGLPRAETVLFSLAAPGVEPAGLNPRFLKLGGTLNNGLGSRFLTLDHNVALPLDDQDPQLRTVAFCSSELQVTLTFALTMLGPV